MTDNIAYDILGSCYFVEDGAEKGTIFERNLGAVVKAVNNGFTGDARLAITILPRGIYILTLDEHTFTNILLKTC